MWVIFYLFFFILSSLLTKFFCLGLISVFKQYNTVKARKWSTISFFSIFSLSLSLSLSFKRDNLSCIKDLKGKQMEIFSSVFKYSQPSVSFYFIFSLSRSCLHDPLMVQSGTSSSFRVESSRVVVVDHKEFFRLIGSLLRFSLSSLGGKRLNHFCN